MGYWDCLVLKQEWLKLSSHYGKINFWASRQTKLFIWIVTFGFGLKAFKIVKLSEYWSKNQKYKLISEAVII